MLVGPGWLGFWHAAEQVPQPPRQRRRAQKGTSDVFLDTCRHGKCPIHIRGPPGGRGREAGALLEEAALPTPCKSICGRLCFPPTSPPPNKMGPSRSSPRSLQSCALLNHPASISRALMGTVWMESQHEPTLSAAQPGRGEGQRLSRVRSLRRYQLPFFLLSEGKASEKLSSGGENNWGGELAR